MKSTRVADQRPSVVDTTRAEYEEKLVQLNRRLGATRAEHRRVGDDHETAEAEYLRTKRRREMVVGENARMIVDRQVAVDRLMADKQRMVAEVNAHRAVVDALYERRQVQYERMLTRLKEDTDFVKTKYEAARTRIEHRAVLMDKITRVLQNATDLKQKQAEGLYAKRQILACSMNKYADDIDKYIENFFEMVFLGRFRRRDQKLIHNINEYNSIVKQFNEHRSRYVPEEKTMPKLCDQKLLLKCKLLEIDTIANMIEKKRRENISKAALYPENLNKSDQEENLKNEPPVELLQRMNNVIKLKENIIQQAITEKESHVQNCSYLKKIVDEIRTVVGKANQYITCKGRPTAAYTDDFNWLLNMESDIYLLAKQRKSNVVELKNNKKTKRKPKRKHCWYSLRFSSYRLFY